MTTLETRLSGIIQTYNTRDDTADVQFALAAPAKGWTWRSPGNPRPYFIASTTKLYVTALILQLRAEGRLDLDEPAARYLGAATMAGLHVLKGTDYSQHVTVRQLLAHTSGLADYFEQRRTDGTTTFGRALKQDLAWKFEEVLRINREELTPRFPPARPGKAFYSDTNYQLLGRIVEEVAGMSFEQSLQQNLLDPLDLHDTYPFTADTRDQYNAVAPMLYGTKPVHIPNTMASVRADGGIVSTAEDGITFLQAFMAGRLFPANYLAELCAEWRAIFPPLTYGVGIMRFTLPRIFTPFQKVPAMIGHSGASGTVLYYVPDLDLYVSGTVNQIKKRSLSYNVMTRLVLACQSVL